MRCRPAAVMIEASRAARRPFRRRSVLWSVRSTHGDGRARRSTAAPYGAALLTASKRARSALSPRAFPRDDASSISPVLGELRCRGWLGSNTRRVPYCSGRSRSKDQHTKLLGIYLSQRACTHLRSSPLEL